MQWMASYQCSRHILGLRSLCFALFGWPILFTGGTIRVTLTFDVFVVNGKGFLDFRSERCIVICAVTS